MIIDDTIRNQVGETVFNTWKDAALADLANMICMSWLDETTDTMTGIVGDDGRHVILPSWYSEVTDVKSTYGTSLEYTIEYIKTDGLTPETKYANVLTLTTPYLPGMAVAITGTHGFNRLPAPLTAIFTAIVQADQSMTDRTDSITSKRIEDVSVTYADATQTTLEHALTPYKALLDTWKLCPSSPDTGGLISMPAPNLDLPWWENVQDHTGGDFTYGTAM
nr:MAG: Protein of unknown function (DUF3199) [Bacteriophage sp.]